MLATKRRNPTTIAPWSGTGSEAARLASQLSIMTSTTNGSAIAPRIAAMAITSIAMPSTLFKLMAYVLSVFAQRDNSTCFIRKHHLDAGSQYEPSP